jgi:NAD(P)-dependent dehydrogenase (short-subunit alcohol dehydrogenase family)
MERQKRAGPGWRAAWTPDVDTGRQLMGNFLEGKTIAVTGGGRGIGRAVCLAAAAEGANVVVADFGVSMDGSEPSSEVADGVVKEIIDAGGQAIAVAGDVATMEGGAAPVQAAVDTYGSIDGVVCVAGILRERMLFNMSEEEFDDVIRVHLKGTFTVFRAASAIMRKQESGSLISFTSGVWSMGSVAQANYAAAKGGIVSLTYSAAVGLNRYGVTANCIAPVARTRMSANVPTTLAENGDPEDIAPMVVYLLSDQAKQVTGQVYSVVGGKIAVWDQPEEVRAMYKDGRWTPQEIAATLDGTVGTERLKMLDMIEASRKAAASGEKPNS